MENDSDISRINNLTFNNSANIGNENWVYLFSGTTVSISIQPLYNLHIAMINVSNHIPLHRLLIFLPNVSIFLSVFSIFIAKFVSLPAIDIHRRREHRQFEQFIIDLKLLSSYYSPSSLVSFSISNQRPKLGRIISRRNLVPKRLRYITFPSNNATILAIPAFDTRNVSSSLPRRRVVPSCSRPSPFR